MPLRRTSIGLALVCGGAVACSAILGLEPPPTDGGSGDDGTVVDGTALTDARPTTDAHTDARPDSSGDAPASDHLTPDAASCTPLDSGDAGTTYHPLWPDEAGNQNPWSLFDTSAFSTLAGNYQGGAFDGRYVYLAPADPNGPITRYDTTALFQSSSSWSTFDPRTLAPGIDGFSGATFDGRYVYFVPAYSVSHPGVVVRYDKDGAFGPGPAWSTFDTATIPGTTFVGPDGGTVATAFRGATYDGRFVYFVPFGTPAVKSGRVVRYDTGGSDASVASDAGDAAQSTFGTDAQWSVFPMTSLDPSALGFVGGVFAGGSVYFAPYENGGATNGGLSGIVSRYDTTKSFTGDASWSFFDTDGLNAPGAFGYSGGAFDGQYVYFAPRVRTVVTRFDTKASSIINTAAWSSFDLAAKGVIPADAGHAGFESAAFDGRFVYFIPGQAGAGLVTRYDTLNPFDNPCAWSTYDVTQQNASATLFEGAVYDGRYMYLVPSSGTWVARFDTKTPASMPQLPAYRGSFY